VVRNSRTSPSPQPAPPAPAPAPPAPAPAPSVPIGKFQRGGGRLQCKTVKYLFLGGRLHILAINNLCQGGRWGRTVCRNLNSINLSTRARSNCGGRCPGGQGGNPYQKVDFQKLLPGTINLPGVFAIVLGKFW